MLVFNICASTSVLITHATVMHITSCPVWSIVNSRNVCPLSDLVNRGLIPPGRFQLEFRKAWLNFDKAAYCNSMKLTVAGCCIIKQSCQQFCPLTVARPKTNCEGVSVCFFCTHVWRICKNNLR